MTAVVKQSIAVTGLVLVMMVIVEYLHVATRGRWRQGTLSRRWQQYALAAFLGATPGCMGAFAVVAMYAHGHLTLGAVVASMLATAGDESFVMFAMFPGRAAFLHAALLLLGFAAAYLADALFARCRIAPPKPCDEMVLHDAEETAPSCERILAQWRGCTAARGALAIALALLLAAVLAGDVGPEHWGWVRALLLLTVSAALIVVSSVSDHFIEEHLWQHVARRHMPRVFLWTTGTMILMHFASMHVDIQGVLQEGRWAVLPAACLMGIIPETGPHLVFVTLYAQGLVPMSILLASSIVQDGHGALPLLAHSRRAFVAVKAVNVALGLAIGGVLLALGH